MTLARIAYPIRSDDATLSGGGWTTAFPLANLKDRLLSRVARSTNATLANTQLAADLGANRAARLISVHNHNLTLSARYRIRGRQAETFTRAGTARFVNNVGVLEVAAAGEARHWHYIGGERYTLLEAARTNLLIRSEEFENAAWTKTDSTITANAIAAPDGTTTADLVTEGSAGTARVARLITVTSGAVTSLSFFVRRGNTDWVRIEMSNLGDSVRLWANLSTKTLGNTTSSGTGAVTASYIQTLANDWVRITLVGALGGVTSYNCTIQTATSNGGTGKVSGGTYYVWGAQAEVGDFPSSYIPTTTATVSRVVDQYSADFPAAFPANGLTFAAEFVEAGTIYVNNARYFHVGLAPVSDARFFVAGISNRRVRARLVNVAGTQSDAESGNDVWDIGDTVRYRAGVEIGTGANAGQVRATAAYSVNGGAFVTVTAGAWIAQDFTVWGSGTIYLNSIGTSNHGTAAFGSVIAAAGDLTYDEAQQATDPLYHFEPYDSTFLDAYPDIYEPGDVLWGETVTGKPTAEDLASGWRRDLFHLVPDNVRRRFWTLELDDTTNADGYVQAGRLVIAPTWDPGSAFVEGGTFGWDSTTSEQESRGGAYFYDLRPERRTWEIAFDLLEWEELVTLTEIQRRIGRGRQFVLVNDVMGVHNRNRFSFLAVLSEMDPIRFSWVRHVTQPFTVREEI